MSRRIGQDPHRDPCRAQRRGRASAPRLSGVRPAARPHDSGASADPRHDRRPTRRSGHRDRRRYRHRDVERGPAAAAWLTALVRRPLSDDELLAAIRESGAGFGVLYRVRDERLVALSAQVVKRQRHDLPHWRLCTRAIDLARRELQLEAHVYLALAALCLDLGFPRDAVAGLGFVLLFHDALANAVEGAAQAPAVLRELPWSEIADRTVPLRTTPRFRSSS